jgi:thiamine biosynthesis lipoprotein
VVERARPLLGTFVSVRVGGLPDARAHHAIDDAFDTIAVIHRLMSAQEPDSDVSRLNRDAARRPVRVDRETFCVLRWSREMAARSDGAFDVTAPGRRGTWRDVELYNDDTVHFRRPVTIDLGGIAKGYAVDRAVARLRATGARQACVNAGGDLRVLGANTARVYLRTDARTADAVPVLDVENGSVASSSGRRHRRERRPHVDPRSARSIGARRFVCVVAQRCIVADALTKVVLVLGPGSERVLRRYGAIAHVHDARGGWRTLGGAA